MSWEPLITARACHTSRAVDGLFRFACKLGHKPVRELVTFYKAKCLSVATYRAGVWGHHKSRQLQVLENKFIERLVMTPNSVPPLPLLSKNWG